MSGHICVGKYWAVNLSFLIFKRGLGNSLVAKKIKEGLGEYNSTYSPGLLSGINEK